MILPVVLMLLGFAFVIAEVFFVSMGLLSIGAISLILTADVLAFQQSDLYGWSLVVAEIVGIPFVVRGAFRVLPKLPFGRRMLLTGPQTRPAASLPSLDHFAGRRGVALSDLRPSGTADIDGTRLTVLSESGMLPAGTEILVRAVDGTEVKVRPVPNATPADGSPT